MTNSHGVELATQIMQDGSVAIPLLRLLYSFRNARGDPAKEAMCDLVLLFIWTKIQRCEDAMVQFILEEEENGSTQAPKAA